MKSIKYTNLSQKIIFKSLIIIFLFVFYSALFPDVKVDKWGISKEKVKTDLIGNEKTLEFTPSEKPDYENKIMNMVNLILKNVESDISEKINIISTKTDPRKDFLFLNNKLFSVLEYYSSISKNNFDNVIKILKDKYGEPNHNQGADIDIYFISAKNTKIIVHYYIKTKICEIYFYDNQLYHKLSSNEY